MKFSTQLPFINTSSSSLIYIGIPNIFRKLALFRVNLERFCDQYSFIVLITVSLQLNEIFYTTSSHYYLAMFLDLFRNVKYYLKNLHFLVLGTWNVFAISTVSLYRLLTIFKWSQLKEIFPTIFSQ